MGRPIVLFADFIRDLFQCRVVVFKGLELLLGNILRLLVIDHPRLVLGWLLREGLANLPLFFFFCILFHAFRLTLVWEWFGELDIWFALLLGFLFFGRTLEPVLSGLYDQVVLFQLVAVVNQLFLDNWFLLLLVAIRWLLWENRLVLIPTDLSNLLFVLLIPHAAVLIPHYQINLLFLDSTTVLCAQRSCELPEVSRYCALTFGVALGLTASWDCFSIRRAHRLICCLWLVKKSLILGFAVGA